MSRFLPMMATQAGGEGGDCGEGERERPAGTRGTAAERERGLGKESEPGASERQTVTQTGREEVGGFQGMTPVPHPHRHASRKGLSQW